MSSNPFVLRRLVPTCQTDATGLGQHVFICMRKMSIFYTFPTKKNSLKISFLCVLRTLLKQIIITIIPPPHFSRSSDHIFRSLVVFVPFQSSSFLSACIVWLHRHCSVFYSTVPQLILSLTRCPRGLVNHNKNLGSLFSCIFSNKHFSDAIWYFSIPVFTNLVFFKWFGI